MINTDQLKATEIVKEATRACKNGTCGILNFVTFDEIKWYYNKYHKTRDAYINNTAVFLASFVEKIPLVQLAGAVIGSESNKYYRDISLIDAIDYLVKIGNNEPDVTHIVKCLKGDTYINDDNIDSSSIHNNCLDGLFSSINECTGFDEKMKQLEKDAEEEINHLKASTEDKEVIDLITTIYDTIKSINKTEENKEVIDLITTIYDTIKSINKTEDNKTENKTKENKTENKTEDNKTENKTKENKTENKTEEEHHQKKINKNIKNKIVTDKVMVIELIDAPTTFNLPPNGSLIYGTEQHNAWFTGKFAELDYDTHNKIYNNIKRLSINDGIDIIHILMVYYFNSIFNINIEAYAIETDKIYTATDNFNILLFRPYYENSKVKMKYYAVKKNNK